MQSIIVIVAAALGLALPTIAMPLEGSSALEVRGTTNYILTCEDKLWKDAASDVNGRELFTFVCITKLGCAHSEAPSDSANEYIGGCLDCPANIRTDAFGGCVIVKQ
ncbi:uncharacterized protein M421DRAFT_425261 [Didymella exigua CBS 183.55]|uniref:Uncharacterized protein n=1 Tax=Didymella exigua CBS 183.55 TaxID=1150837 RepID=A0A6A5R6Y5_9PLEO|nr:uncharacterized protein M421DRAFT_425261 [Didymella exigua CBS 183.55]KAF1923921.1 hypothetical protein M421DRAFT_425261 [Didymella exigua CBS 183.55]